MVDVAEKPQLLPLWYQGTYQLAAQRLHVATAIEEGIIRQPDYDDFDPPALRRAATKDAIRLLRTTVVTLLWLDFQFRRISLHGREWWSERRSLWEALLENIEPSSALLLAGAQLESKPMAQRGPEDRLSRPDLLRMPREKLAAQSPWTLEEFAVATKRGRLSPRARYNHACFLTRAAAIGMTSPKTAVTANGMDQAEAELLLSLDQAGPALRGRLAGWALEDPTLKPLRDSKPTLIAELVRRGARITRRRA